MMSQMTPVRYLWLLPRVRRHWLYSPWLVDRWLEELAIECDEDQWERLRRVLGWTH